MSENQFSFREYNFDLFVLLLFYVSLENISFNMETSPLSVRGCEMPDKSKGIFIVPRMSLTRRLALNCFVQWITMMTEKGTENLLFGFHITTENKILKTCTKVLVHCTSSQTMAITYDPFPYATP